MRTDMLSSFSSGFQQGINSLLQTIQVVSGTTTVRTYTLSYRTNTAGSSLLSTMTVTGADNTSALPPTTFTYQDNTAFTSSVTSSYQPQVDFVGRWQTQSSVNKGTALLDVNGDGLP